MTKPGGYFTIESGSLAGQQIAIAMETRPIFVIGSDPRCDLQLTDGAVAPVHVAIILKDGVYYAKPRYITQPVIINGNRVQKVARINSGDSLRVGDVSLTFQDSLFALMSPPPPKLSQLRGQEPASEPPVLPKKNQKPVRKKVASHSSSNNWSGVIAIMVSALVLIGLVGVVAMDQVNKAAPDPKYATFAEGSVTVVTFHADWCGYCQQQKPIVNNVGREFGDTVTVVLVDVDDPNNYAQVDYYSAYNIPYTLILDEYGEVTYQFTGLTNADTLITAIETVLATTQPLIEPDEPGI